MVLNRLHNGASFSVSFYIQLVWLLLDLVIILTWQLYRRRERLACVKDFCCFAGAFLIVLLGVMGIGWEISAFAINLTMSVSFVIRARKAPSNWTSLFIAITKLLGTLAATMLDGLLRRNALVLWLGGICMIFDIYYVYILTLRKEGKNNETL